ncbi:hypothetical protein [Actinoplanes sp. N902-109]|uniref:hypothetical protein n=1 Tax=Actinoplanes sp. (strain N902-109) TaxID=649831 RepID=UPI0003295BA5|nr:hypothetical protein [Actinoplanes sp. N902-109]AGL14067.1 hypothetical protein L083_0557 [Actinoplanes sp. N902-109]
MRTPIDTTIFGTASLLTLAFGGAPDTVPQPVPRPEGPPDGFVGFWQNTDGSVRLCLAEDWSYEGRVKGRRRAAKGTYHPSADGLVLRDETGLRTPVVVAEHGLEMAGHQLFRS